MGDSETALRTGAEAMELTEGAENSPIAAWSGGAYARALLESGDAAGAHRVFVERCGGLELTLIPSQWQAIWLEQVVRCLLVLGELDEARRIAGAVTKQAA
jgi:hypothetical protein